MTTPDPERKSQDGTPAWAYDEDGYCVCCGNGRWKFHVFECELRDALDALSVAIPLATATERSLTAEGRDE